MLLLFPFHTKVQECEAVEGLEELKKHLDTVIVVPNQNLFKIANEKTGLKIFFFIERSFKKWSSKYNRFDGQTWNDKFGFC